MSRRSPREYAVYGFETTHAALEAEELLKAAAIGVVPIPTPRVLGASCGIAMRVAPEESEVAEQVMSEGGASWTSKAVLHDV